MLEHCAALFEDRGLECDLSFTRTRAANSTRGLNKTTGAEGLEAMFANSYCLSVRMIEASDVWYSPEFPF